MVKKDTDAFMEAGMAPTPEALITRKMPEEDAQIRRDVRKKVLILTSEDTKDWCDRILANTESIKLGEEGDSVENGEVSSSKKKKFKKLTNG